MHANYLFNCIVRENIADTFPIAPLEQVMQVACRQVRMNLLWLYLYDMTLFYLK